MSSRFLRGTIHRQEMQKLEALAHQCTIGAGEIELEEPTLDSIQALQLLLGRALTKEDLDLFAAVWRRCIQEAQQP